MNIPWRRARINIIGKNIPRYRVGINIPGRGYRDKWTQVQGTVKRPKFGNGPLLRHLFSDNILPGKTVINIVTKSKLLLIFFSLPLFKNYRDIQMH
jgi:hypothetical protein